MQLSASHFLTSRTARTLAAVAGLFLFYAIGVIARQLAGVRIVIRNETNAPVRELSAQVENTGDRHTLQDLAPGDQERVFLHTAKQSHVVVEFAETGRAPRPVTVFNQDETGACSASTMRILPQRRTESVEKHEAVCWNSWLDFL